MNKNSILAVPLTEVLRAEIALPLQQVLRIYTVGGFLSAWKNPHNHHSIEQVFDTPQQAHHAVSVCAAWLGVRSAPALGATVATWWTPDELSLGKSVPQA